MDMGQSLNVKVVGIISGNGAKAQGLGARDTLRLERDLLSGTDFNGSQTTNLAIHGLLTGVMLCR